MDLIADYSGSSSSDAPAASGSAAKRSMMVVNCAPTVLKADLSHSAVIDTKTKELKYNPTYDELYAPIVGPTNPNDKVGLMRHQNSMGRNHFAGHVEDHMVNNFSFDQQYHDFVNKGRAADPNGNNQLVNTRKSEPKTDEQKKRLKRGRPEDLDGYKGPWAGYEGEDVVVELTEEQKEWQEKQLAKAKVEKEKKYEEDSTTWHGKDLKDYRGRSWTEAPPGLKTKNDHLKCYIPKKWIHTWSGHTAGVSSIRFFPGTAHLLLSSGLDNKIKIWDVHNNRSVLRTYMGHTGGVKEVNFNNDGTKFISCSYDKKMKVWDTETGACLGTFSSGKMSNSVVFNPDEDKQDIFVAACHDKKIQAWDIRANEVIQTYEYHLSAVNSITFCDENRRFISTSDDKKILVWEWGIPVVMKHISEPHMHSCPVVRMHPNQNFALMQSLDNQIVTYGTKDRFKLNRKKRFAGHVNAAFACELGVSPDGQFVYSGDGDGNLFFWDWKTTKIVKKIKCHDKVTIGCSWHPLETSKLVTCSWDGTIKLWD